MADAGLGYSMGQPAAGLGQPEVQQPQMQMQQPQAPQPAQTMAQRRKAILELMDRDGVDGPTAARQLGYMPPAVEPATDIPEAAPEEAGLGLGERMATTTRNAMDSALTGSGRMLSETFDGPIGSAIGGALEGAGDMVGASDEATERVAEAGAERETVLGKAWEGALNEAGPTAALIGGIWGARKFKGNIAKTMATMGVIMNSVGRVYDEASGNRDTANRDLLAARTGRLPQDIPEEEVRAAFTDDDNLRSMASASTGLLEALPFARLFKEVPGAAALQQKLGQKALEYGSKFRNGIKEGLTTAGLEAAQEYSQSAITDILTDEDTVQALRNRGDEPWAKEVLDLAMGAKGQEWLISGIAGGMLGGGPGAVSGAVEQGQVNKYAEKQARQLEDTARQRGSSTAEINEVITRGDAKVVAKVAKEIDDRQITLNQSEEMLTEAKGAVEQGKMDPADLPAFEGLVEKRKAELDDYMDGAGKTLGITTWQKKADVERAKTEEATQRRAAGVERLQKHSQTPNKDIDADVVVREANRLDEAEGKVSSLRARAEVIADPVRKAEAQRELDDAVEERRAARVSAKMSLNGMTHTQATEAVRADSKKSAVDKRRDAQQASREKAVERQTELEMPATMPEAQRKARAQEILDEDAATSKADKGLDTKINRLARQRRAATSDTDIDRLTNEIADLEARRGLPTPAVEAARRVLQVPEGQSQAGTAEISLDAGNTDEVTPGAVAGAAVDQSSTTPTGKGEKAIGAATPPSKPEPVGAAAFIDVDPDTVISAALEAGAADTLNARTASADKLSQLLPGAPKARLDIVTEAATQLQNPDITPEERRILTGVIERDIKKYATKPEKTAPKADKVAPKADKSASAEPAGSVADTSGYDLPNGMAYRDLTADYDSKTPLYDFMREQTKSSGNEVGGHVRDGNAIAIGTNDLPNAIMPPRAGYADPDVTFVHTHIADTPFSAADVRAMLHGGQPFVALLPNGENIAMKPLGPYDQKAEELMFRLMRDIANAVPRDMPALDRARIRQEAMLQLLEINGNLSYDTPFAALSEPHMEIVNGIVTELEATLARDGTGNAAGTGTAQDAGRPVGPARASDTAIAADQEQDAAVDNDLGDDEFGDTSSSGVLDNQATRSSRRDRRPDFDRAKVTILATDVIAARKKRGATTQWYKDYVNGDLTQEQIEAGLRKAIELHGFKKMMVLPEMVRAMYPETSQLSEADFESSIRKQSGSTRDGQTYQKLIDKRKEMNFKAALELTNDVRLTEHGSFGRQMNNLMKGNFGFRTAFLEASPELMNFVGFKTPGNARFDPPVADPNDVSLIKRNPRQMAFSEEAMVPLERTAKYLQANRYTIDEKKLYALRPDDMISGKAYGAFGFKASDVARMDALLKTPKSDWSDADRFKFTDDGVALFMEARRSAEYKLQQLKEAYYDFVAVNGEGSEVGFLYQVDNRGRIYADGSFHPQAGSKIKALFQHEGVSLGDMVEVDNAASGWQVNALIARDHIAAPKLNMGAGQATDPDFKKQDLYTDTLNNMRGLMKRDAAIDTSKIKNLRERRAAEATKRNAQMFLDGPFRDGVPIPVDRAAIKPAIIAVNYGGKTKNFQDIFLATLKKHLNANDLKVTKDKPWGYISNLGLEALRETAPHSLDFQQWAIDSIAKAVTAIEKGSKRTDAPKLELSIGLAGKFSTKKYGRLDGEVKARSKSGGQLAFKMEGNTKKEYVGPDGLLVPLFDDKGNREVKEDQVTVRLKVNRDAIDPQATARAHFANMIQGFDAQILHRAVERYKKATDGAFITTNHDSFTVPRQHEGAVSAAVRESMGSIMTEVDVPARLYAELMSEAARNGVKLDIKPFENMGSYNMDDLMSSSPLFGEAPGRPDDFVPTYDVLPDTEPFLRMGVDDEPAAVPGTAAPLYVSRPVRNAEAIKAWAEAQGLPVTMPLDKMHVTTAYSTAPVDTASTPPDQDGRTSQGPVRGTIQKFGDNLVLEFAPDVLGLGADHQKYNDAGASYDFPTYRPHITLNEAAGDVSIDGIVPFEGELALGREDQRQLEEDTDPTDPDKAPLPSAGQDIDMANYMEQLPETQSLLNKMQAWAANPKEVSTSMIRTLDRSIFNGFQPIRTLERKMSGDGTIGIGMDSAFKAAEMATNDSGRNEALLYYGAGSIGTNGEFQPAAGTVGLRDIFKTASGGKKDGQRLQHWFEYMAALRAKELKAEGIKVPLSDADINAALAREGQDFKDARAQWQAHNRANLKMVLDSGRISQEQHDAMATDDFYVPFYRVDQKMDGTSPDLHLPEFKRTAGGALRMRDPGIKEMKGGDTVRIANMAQNMVRNSQAMTAAAMRNVAANKTFDLMEQAGIVKFAPGNAPKKPKDAIARYKDGKEDWVVPQDDDAVMIIGALGGLAPIQVDGVAAALNGIASVFRGSITSKPSFILNNLWRGALANGLMTSGANLTVSSNTMTGALSALGVRNDQAYREFKQISGMGDYRMGQAETGFGKSDILVDIGLERPGAGYYPRKVWQAWETLGTASEMADRIAVYETMKAKGVRPDEAAYQALNVMNYSRKGGNATVRHWITTMPFLNARLQGYARLAEGTVGRKATPETRKAALQRMALTGLIYTAATAAAWTWNNDDEERREIYQNLPTWRRTMFFNVVLPNGFVLTLPQPFELGFLFSSLPSGVMDQFADSVPWAPDGIEPIDNALTQVGAKVIGDTLAFSVIPQAIAPLLEGGANYNTFFGSPIETQAETSLQPDLRDTNADEFAKAIGQDIDIFGKPLSNRIRMSPAMIAHYGSNYGGVPYTMMAGLFDTFAADAGLAPPQPATAFGESSMARFASGVLRGFAFDPTVSRDRWTDEYYKAGRKATEMMRSFKDTGEIERLDGAMGAPAAYQMFNSVNSTVSDLKKAERAVRESETMGPAEKRRRLQAITKARNTIMEASATGMTQALAAR